MKYQKYYFIDLWDLITILKKDIDNNYKVTFFTQTKGRRHHYRWKCFESKIIYELHHNEGYFFKNVPDFFEKALDGTDLVDLKDWIKENSKNIDSLNRLKAFT
jgi:hypothetical protein